MDAASIQKGQLDAFSGQLTSFAKATGERLDGVRAESATGAKQLREEVMGTLKNISERMAKIMKDLVVAKQLDQMQQTMDEKLQGTLKKRLGESFKQVSERLEQMHKGFLEKCRHSATGIGDLKKVLTNVKTRGTWGKVQLGTLLEQVLNPDQFVNNAATKGGGERVEFAIKLPEQGANRDETVWLPIDAKFSLTLSSLPKTINA